MNQGRRCVVFNFFKYKVTTVSEPRLYAHTQPQVTFANNLSGLIKHLKLSACAPLVAVLDLVRCRPAATLVRLSVGPFHQERHLLFHTQPVSCVASLILQGKH